MRKALRYAGAILGVLIAVYFVGYCVYVFSIV